MSDSVPDPADQPDGDAAGTGPPKRPLLLLVDGSSYLYRAYHAMPDLRGPGDVPTGAIHGMVAMMRRLREQFPAEHAACVFDAPGTTFRDDWYADYKANRSAMPEPLAAQVEAIHEMSACSAGRSSAFPASRPTTPSARWRAPPRRPATT